MASRRVWAERGSVALAGAVVVCFVAGGMGFRAAGPLLLLFLVLLVVALGFVLTDAQRE
jgi:hypothetical protein